VSSLKYISGAKLSYLAASFAIALSNEFDLSDVNILSGFFSTIGDVLGIIAAQQAAVSDHDDDAGEARDADAAGPAPPPKKATRRKPPEAAQKARAQDFSRRPAGAGRILLPKAFKANPPGRRTGPRTPPSKAASFRPPLPRKKTALRPPPDDAQKHKTARGTARGFLVIFIILRGTKVPPRPLNQSSPAFRRARVFPPPCPRRLFHGPVSARSASGDFFGL
jgi:hypothetical protein